MIGFFLVLVSAICALCRGLSARIAELIHRRRLGHLVLMESDADGRDVLFVQYFIRGREYWYWELCKKDQHGSLTDSQFEELGEDLEETLLSQTVICGPPKVESAHLRTTRGLIDVTELLRQLSGPRRDFYGRLSEIVRDDDAIVGAYLQARSNLSECDDLSIRAARLQKWVGCEVRIVPGSVMPFKPLVFRCDDTEDKDD